MKKLYLIEFKKILLLTNFEDVIVVFKATEQITLIYFYKLDYNIKAMQ
jgi:hypothetical protein